MTREDVARRTVVHHDNVFGQLNYDTLMINKSFKTVLQIALRAPGWQLGNIRSVVNAFRYQGKEFSRAASKGEAPLLTPEMSWMVTTLAVHMAEAAIIGYGMAAMTGDDRLKPTEFADFMFPKISAVTKVMPPGYVKDWAALLHGVHNAPTKFIENFITSKFAGSWGRMAESWRNRDHYGAQVYNPDESAGSNAADIAIHQIPHPMSEKSMRAEAKSGETNPVAHILSAIGYNKVPSWVENTAAITKALTYKGTTEPMTKEEKAHHELIVELSGQFKNNPQKGAESISKAIQEGKLAKKDLVSIKNHVVEPPLERMFKPLKPLEAMEVWKVANPEERKQLSVDMARKMRSLANKSPEERQAAFKKWTEITKGAK